MVTLHISSPPARGGRTSQNVSVGSSANRLLPEAVCLRGGKALVLPPVIDPTSAEGQLVASIGRMSAERGELLATLSAFPTAEDGQKGRVEEKVERIDRCMQTLIVQYVSDGGRLGEGLKDLAIDLARRTENKARFYALVEQVYDAGLHVGAAQGRSTKDSRLARGVQLYEEIKSNATRAHRDPLSIFDGAPSLNEAIDAARHLGERQGITAGLHAENAAAVIYRAIGGWRAYFPRGWFKDYQRVVAIVRSLTPDEAHRVKDAFQDLTGKPLVQSLAQAFGSTNAAHLALTLEAETTKAATLILKGELTAKWRLGSARGAVCAEIYSKLSVPEIREMESRLASTLHLSLPQLHALYSTKLPAVSAKQLAAYREGDQELANVFAVHSVLSQWWGRGEVRRILERIPPAQMDSFERRYKSETGTALKAALSERIGYSPASDHCRALLDKDIERVRAAQVACALAYRRDYIGAPFIGLAPDERSALILLFNRVYHPQGGGDFWSDLKKAVWREDYFLAAKVPLLCRFLERLWWPTTNSYPFIESIIRNGKLAPAELLRYFMVGIGTDVEGIRAVLSNRTQENIKEIEADYARRYPPGFFSRVCNAIPVIRYLVLTGDLRHDLKVELSGDNEYDVMQLLKGLPGRCSEKELCSWIREGLDRRYRFENSGVLLRKTKVLAFRGDGVIRRRYELDYQSAADFHEKFIKDNPRPTHDTIVRFLTLARIAEIQASSFRESKRSLAEVALNSGAFIGVTTCVSFVAFHGLLSFWHLAAASFVGSLVWRMATGFCILGQSFGRGEISFHIARAAVDGSSMFTVRLGAVALGQLVGQWLSKTLAKSGYKLGLNQFVKFLEEKVRRQDKARHVLNEESSLQTNKELRAIIQGYGERLGGVEWQVGDLQDPRVPGIEQILTGTWTSKESNTKSKAVSDAG